MSSSPRIPYVPILRALIPFGIGIMLHDAVMLSWISVLLIAAASVSAYALLAWVSRSPEARLKFATYYTIPIYLLLSTLGFATAKLNAPVELPLAKVNGKYVVARVLDVKFSDFSMSIKLSTSSYCDSAGKCVTQLPEAKAIISTKGCNYNLKPGDIVLFKADLAPITNSGNPDEVDYAGIMRRQGYLYTQHIDRHSILACGHTDDAKTIFSNARADVQRRILSTNISEVSKSMVIATLLGNSDLVDAQIRQDFAAAGVAHLLALSGLHVGILTFVLWWFLFPLDYLQLKKLRLTITVLCLALYAMFTGLSPSVLRATVMCGFVLVSLLSHRKANALNSLAFAALLILVFSPNSLYSVGFQLSFITVLSLLLFGQIYSTRFRLAFVNQLVSLLLTSLVAMVSTLALTAFYYHTVSILSALTNILILPIFPLFIFVGLLFIVLSLAGMQPTVVTWALEALSRYITAAIDAVNSLPFSHVEGIYIDKISVAFYFLALAFTFLWLYGKSARFFICAVACLAVIIIDGCAIRALQPANGIVVFNDFSSTPVVCFSGSNSILWVPDAPEFEFDTDSFKRRHIGFLSHQGISSLTLVQDSSALKSGFITKGNSAILFGKKFIFAGKGHWKQPCSTSATADYLLVSKMFHGKIKYLRNHISAKSIILSGAIYPTNKAALQSECHDYGLKCWSLADSGAIVITNPDINRHQ